MANRGGGRTRHQKLPAAGPAREGLRRKGQFWTPAWVADAMAAYVLGNGSDHLFDPAVGEGAFLRAGKAAARELGRAVDLFGTELDPDVLTQAGQSGLTHADLAGVHITDFVLSPPRRRFRAIVANPPYIRHHRLTADTKAALKSFAESLTGSALDGRAGFHVYFLLRALTLLDAGGRLAFIVPADTCEGKFAPQLWEWISASYRLDAVLTFEHDASPFPGVDTNAVVLFIENAPPGREFAWARCTSPETRQVKEWVISGFTRQSGAILLQRRGVAEGISTGLSRPPVEDRSDAVALSDFASVMRGIATGANEFFYLTRDQAEALGLPDEFLFPAVGRTRDVPGDAITEETLTALDKSGRPSLLFSPSGEAPEFFPEAMRAYLMRGEELGLHRRPLIATRKPWYKMETRPVPPILFAYLGRRNARFIRNFAGALPLTGFLCVYPHVNDPQYIERLWEVLKHPDTIKNLARVGKSYGAGAIKVEPRGLEKLPLPQAAILRSGLPHPGPRASAAGRDVGQGLLFVP
ncbi:MAG TPA: N-6 DNA methylase [Pyrinomonadaceae bacterium]|nr:N-6 DNA methylase [Pyrinomonadaceae bacterium]